MRKRDDRDDRVALRVGRRYGILARTLLRQVEARSPRQWLVDNLMRSGDLVEIVEDAKSGKTTLTAGLLCAVKRGVPFLGQATTRAKVAYFGMEHDIRDLMPIFKANGVNNFPTIPNTEPYQFPNKQAYKNLKRYITRCQLRCVALDPITDFIQFDAPEFGHDGFDENKATHWKLVIDPLLRIVQKTGCAIIFDRHKSKAATGRRGSKGVSVGRGSNYPETKASVVLNLTRFGNAGWSLTVNGKGIPRQDMWLISGDGRYTFQTEKQRAKQIKTSTTYSQYHDGLVKSIQAILEQHGGAMLGQSFLRELKRLRKSGVDVPMRGPAYTMLLRDAGIVRTVLHGRVRFAFGQGDRKGDFKGEDTYVDTPKVTPKVTLRSPPEPTSSPRKVAVY